jgi:hypothetical protein
VESAFAICCLHLCAVRRLLLAVFILGFCYTYDTTGDVVMRRLLIFVALSSVVCFRARAQDVVYTPVQVSDTLDRPIAHVVLTAKGNSSTSPPTDKAGKTRLVLPSSFVPGTSMSLVLVDSPVQNLRFLSPWEGHATIPLHDEVDVVLGVPGDLSMLNSPQVRMAMRGAIAAGANGPGGPAAALDKVAADVGLKRTDVSGALDKFAKNDARFANQRRRSTVDQNNANAKADVNKDVKDNTNSSRNSTNSTSKHNHH